MNLLITGAWQDAKNRIPEIKAMGHEIVFMQHEKEDLSCDRFWVEGVIGNSLFLTHSLDQFPNLKYIQLISAGYDRVDLDEVRKRNIEIHNAKGVYSIPMAEFAICGVLEIYKKAKFFWKNQYGHKWEKDRSLLELYGKTVGIIGCGDVGEECAKRFKAFGCSIIKVHRDLAGLNDALQADIVVVTIALTEETRELIKPTMMRRNSILVSLSRGAVIDHEDMQIADQLLGAVLDVFTEEPLGADSELWDKESFIITPHNSFVGDGNKGRLWNVIKNNLLEAADAIA